MASTLCLVTRHIHSEHQMPNPKNTSYLQIFYMVKYRLILVGLMGLFTGIKLVRHETADI